MTIARSPWPAALVLALSACASPPRNLEHVGRSFADAEPADAADAEPAADSDAEPAAEQTPPSAEPPPDDVVLRAALPYAGIRAEDGAQLSAAALMSELSRADAICVGERHGAAYDHFAELATIEALAARREMIGFELGVGFEMFQHDTQPALDAFGSGRIELEELVRHSGYPERWGLPIQFYAPQLEAAQAAGGRLVALNARRELTRAVARGGIDDLPRELLRELPELDLDDASHRALFDELIEGHPQTNAAAPSPEQMYLAQVVWDETMATKAAEWLAGRAPARKLIILAGRAHCARPAIPTRVERRGPFRVLSVLPEVVSQEPPPGAAHPPSSGAEGRAEAPPADGASAGAQAKAAPSGAGSLADNYDYRLVMYRR